MEEQSALSLAEDAIRGMNQELKPLSIEYRHMKSRIDTLAIFSDRPPGPQSKTGDSLHPKAQLSFNSTPEEELIFEHRALYEYVTNKKNELDELMVGVTASDEKSLEELRKAGLLLFQIQRESQAHLKAIREILCDLRERIENVEGRMVAITHERAKMTQAALQHRDKMSIARDAVKSSGSMKENLAKKYGMTLEQVEDMIAAKPALTQEIEAQVEPVDPTVDGH